VRNGAGTLSRQALLLTRRDLKVETRAGEALLVTLPFGATALLLIPLAVGADAAILRDLAPGLFWSVVLLFGSLVTVRQSALEPPAHRDALALLGVDPVARFLARTGTTATLLAVVHVVLAPLAIVLYDPDLAGWLWLGALAPLASIGLAALGSLTSAMTARTRGRATLGPLLLVPLALPVVVAGTQVMEGAVYGESPIPWLLLLVAMDLIVLSVGVAAAPWVEEEDS
jgi:heme exporter protein B